MATYAYAKIYVFDKDKNVLRKMVDIDVNYMKNCKAGHWIEALENGIDFDFPQDKFDSPYSTTLGYISTDALKKKEFKNHVSSESENFVIVDETFDLKPHEENFQFRKELKDRDDKTGYKLLKKKNIGFDETWVTLDLLENIVIDYDKKLEEAYGEYFHLKKIASSLNYYRLNDEQKNDLNNDILYKQDEIEMLKQVIKACEKMKGAMAAVYEEYKEEYSDILVAWLYLW